MAARALGFDLDGTLVDSREDLATAANAARAELGLEPWPMRQIQRCIGDGAVRLVERVTPGAGDADRRRALAAFHASYERGCCGATRAYDGIAGLLATLADAGWRIGVCTNKPLAYVGRILAHCGIDRLVHAAEGGDRWRKPDPAGLRAVLASLRAEPALSWMAGDHHTDLDAGHAAGCRVILCAWGFGDAADRAWDVRIEAPEELPAAIAGA